MPSWCQELAAGDQFSFSNDSLPSVELDGGGCACWSASVKNGGFILGAWAQRVDCGNPDHDHLKWLSDAREGGAIVHAMTRYKKEMLESLGDVPECAYELSLKDLVVDLPRIAKAGQGSPTKGASSSNGKSKAGRKEKVRKQRGSRCTIKGFFRKMFFPVPPKRNKRSIGSSRDDSNSGNNSNKSTTPLMKDGGKAGAAKSARRRRPGKQQPAVLEREPSRKPRGCCHLFQNSKNQSSMA